MSVFSYSKPGQRARVTHGRFMRSNPTLGVLEALEDRRLLSVAPIADHELAQPAWFASVPKNSALRAESFADNPESRWIIRLTSEATSLARSPAGAESWLNAFGSSSFDVLHGLGLPGQVLAVTSADSAEALASLRANPYVATFQPDQEIRGQATPNDPEFLQDNMTGLQNLGDEIGRLLDADIDATEAWDVEKGSRSVVVGVLDTGIDYSHPDLAANIWTNPGEIAGNGIDDDGNCFVDDVHGFNFILGGDICQGAPAGNGDPRDDDTHGHGTHVAGTIGAVGNNGQGVVGVNWTTSLMALKVLNARGVGFLGDAVQAINYANMMSDRGTNVRVLNASWEFFEFESALESAIQRAQDRDILFVAAAGNGDAFGWGWDIDGTPVYPAGYENSNIIAVAASDESDRLGRFSNFGVDSVDLAAPGTGVLSALPGGKYGTLNGTSMAAAHVSGVAALYLSKFPEASFEEVRTAILRGVDIKAGFQGKVATSGRLNAFGALSTDAVRPRAALETVPDMETLGAKHLDLVVDYTDNGSVDRSSLDGRDVVVVRASTKQQLPTALASITDLPGGGRRAIYRLNAVGGAWDFVDNDDYEVRLKADEVADQATIPNFAREQVLGTFKVYVTDGTFQVNTTDDTEDAHPGDAEALDANGKTSLRAALQEANALDIPFTIYLPEGYYLLTLDGQNEDAARTGDLDIRGKVKIVGSGATTTVISAKESGTFGIDRVLDVHVNAELDIADVTITGGSLPHPNSEGGGIRNVGVLRAQRIVIQDSGAESGGGLYNSGRAEIDASTIHHNRSWYWGGGISSWASGTTSGGDLLTRIGGNVRLEATSPHYAPDVALYSDGRMLVTWQSNGDPGSPGQISAQLLHANGTPLSSVFPISNAGDAINPSVAIAADGRAMIVWQQSDGADWDIYGRRITPQGTADGNPFRLNSFTGGDQISPRMSMRPNGELLVVWEGATVCDDVDGVEIALFDAQGVSRPLLDRDRCVNDRPNGRQGSASAAFAASGEFLVAFSGDNADGSGQGVVGQRFDAQGRKLSNNFGINSSSTGDQVVNDVAAIESGYVVAWQTIVEEVEKVDIFFRRLDLLAEPVGVDTIIAPYGDQRARNVSIAPLADGGFTVVFAFYLPADEGISLIRIDDQGEVIGFLRRRVSDERLFTGRSKPAIIADVAGRLSVVWNGTLLFGPAIILQQYEVASPDDVPPPSGLFMTNSTISSNNTTQWAGGILGNGIELTNCTIAHNRIVLSNPIVQGGTLYAQNSLFIDNDPGAIQITTLESRGNNLFTDAQWAGPNDIVDPTAADFLGPLDFNDGPTPTHALLPGSRAIDTGANVTVVPNATQFDQRGLPRPQDGADADVEKTVDIGAVEVYYATLSGRRFHDLNNNGVYDAGEPGLSGLRIFLDLNENGVLEEIEPRTTTVADDPATPGVNEAGLFELPNLAPRSYLVRAELQAGWSSLPAAGHQVTLFGGEVRGGMEFADFPQAGEIRGKVFNDANEDGVRAFLESGLAGWTVFLDANDDGERQVSESLVPTDANGDFAFTGLSPFATYNVRQIQQDGWRATAPAAGKTVVTLGAGERRTAVNFGNVDVESASASRQGSLAGTVYVDANANGLLDAGEQRLPNHGLYFDQNDNGQLDVEEQRFLQYTDANGNYIFEFLGEETFRVRALPIANMPATAPLDNHFTATTDVGLGAGPRAVAAIDFNHDGRLDLAVANKNSNSVSLLRNEGNGVFVHLGVLENGQTGAHSIVVGQFDNLPGLDLAVANYNSSSVSIFVSSGNWFDPASPIQVGSAPTSLTAGDWNGDGAIDLAVAHEFPSEIRILRNNGAGVFAQAGGAIGVGDGAMSIVAAHIYSEQWLDLVVASFDAGTVSVLRNLQGASFGSPGSITVGAGASSVVAADINGDLANGLLVTSFSSNELWILLNDGAGSLSPLPAIKTGVGPTVVQAADLDGDDDLDIVVSNTNTSADNLTVVRNRGRLRFDAPQSYGAASFPESFPTGLITGHFDQDQKTDVAVIKGVSNNATVLQNSFTDGAYRVRLTGVEQVSGLDFGFRSAAVPPTLNSIADATINEDASAQVVTLTGISAGVGDVQPLRVSATSADPILIPNPQVTYASPSATGALSYRPQANRFGTTQITVTVTDGGTDGQLATEQDNQSVSRTFTVTVRSVNDVPVFTAGQSQSVFEDSAARTVANWATGVSAGDAQEGAQTLQFLVETNQAALFQLLPEIAANGTLRFTPAANAFGTATITVRLRDDGGTARGGVDVSPAQTFSIEIRPVNDAPTFTKGQNQLAEMNSGQHIVAPWATGITSGPPNESDIVTFGAFASPQGLFSDLRVLPDGTLAFVPVANATGLATVLVVALDNGGDANGGDSSSDYQTFYIRIVPLLGDTDNDGKVDLNDLNSVRNSFGSNTGAGDADHDGDCDLDDLNLVRNNFGRSAASSQKVADFNQTPRIDAATSHRGIGVLEASSVPRRKELFATPSPFDAVFELYGRSAEGLELGLTHLRVRQTPIRRSPS